MISKLNFDKIKLRLIITYNGPKRLKLICRNILEGLITVAVKIKIKNQILDAQNIMWINYNENTS